MSEQQSRSRAEFLRADYAEVLQVSGRMVDWKASSIWALLVGLIVGSGIGALSVPLLWIAFGMAVGASVWFAVRRRSVIRDAGEELLAIAARASEVSDWDRTAMNSVPLYMKYPEDLASASELERLLRIEPEDAKEQSKTSRPLLAAVLISSVLMVVGVALVGVPGIIWLISSFQSPYAGIVAFVLLTALFAIIAAGQELQKYIDNSRAVSALIVPMAVAELPRLWQADNSFTGGRVVRYTATGYQLDPTAMSVPPEVPKSTKLLRTAAIVLGGIALFAVLLAIAVDAFNRYVGA